MATVGPACDDERGLARLVRAGVDVFRLNQSHGTRDEHRALLRRIRSVGERLGVQTATVVDLMGPRYRIGELAAPVRLRAGQEVELGEEGARATLPVNDQAILRHLEPGERVLIDNGLLELEVTRKRRARVRARVIAGGVVHSRKGINLPDSDLPFAITPKDRRDIAMAVEEGADFLAASYVGAAADVEQVRRVMRRSGGELPIIAKLERARAVARVDEIVVASDAVMVARGDLGVEVPLHRVPVIQKQIVDAAWRLGKPVVVATQMLESMIEQPRPTRAESSDVANAVFDGADALMLSGETATGRYPTEAVRTMADIIVEAEAHRLRRGRIGAALPGYYDLEPPERPGTEDIPETVSAASVQAALKVDARCIVALTQGGFTARQIAARRPSRPVFAATASPETARRLQLVWGIRALLFSAEVEHHAEVVALIDRLLLRARVATPGDVIVLLMGDPIRSRPPTNLMRIHRVRKQPLRRTAQGRAAAIRGAS